MVSQIAPQLESQAYIEQPIAPPSTSVGSLFAGFLRNTKPTAPSASSISSQADIAFGEAVSSARQIEDPTERAKIMREAAITLISTTGDMSEDQALLYRGITGESVDLSFGVDPVELENEQYLATKEGQAFANLVRSQAKSEGLTLTDEQVADLAIAQRDEYQAGQQLVLMQEQRLKLGLPIEDTPIVKSIKQDAQIMFTAFDDALKDGIVTEQEKLSISSQIRQFGSLKYGQYRKVNPTVDQYLTQMEGLAQDLANYDETEVLLDSIQTQLSGPDANPLEIAVIRESIQKNPQLLIESGAVDLSSYTEKLSSLKLGAVISSSVTLSDAEITKLAEDAISGLSGDTTSDFAVEDAINTVVHGTLILNTVDLKDKLQGDSTTRTSFYNQTSATLKLIELQEDTILNAKIRGLVTDESFLENIRTFAQMDPTKGEKLVALYEGALNSELTRMTNQIEGVLTPVGEGLLDITDGKFSLDLDALEGVLEERADAAGQTGRTGDKSVLYAWDQIRTKIEQSGGLEGYYRLSASQQAVSMNSSGTGPRINLDQLIGANLKQVVNLRSEWTKLTDSLDSVQGLRETLGFDVPPVGDVPTSGTELGKLGSEQSPYSFEGMSNDEARSTFDSMSVGSFFVNPADNKLYEIVSRTENETVFRDVETGQQFK